MRKYEKQVQAGVNLLDKKNPTWRKQIDKDRLIMWSVEQKR